MNPCPCGYFGDLKRECRCGPLQVQRYRQRISGPLLDRIDLHIEVPAVEYRDISSTRTEEGSAAIRDRVQRARERQQRPFRFRQEDQLQRPDGPAPDQTTLQAHRRIPGADPRRDDRTESQRPRLRPHPESLPHRRRPRSRATQSPPNTSAKRSNTAPSIGPFGCSSCSGSPVGGKYDLNRR